ncbi:MAG: hypothetical protein IAI50_18475 [Candidatus Eremiobacteraeota bacterium]|nr:hypothetical protein [Candidatus Eremiobacteraeota bacterium]
MISVAQARPLGMRFHEVFGPGPTSTVTSPTSPRRDPKVIEFDAPGAATKSSKICKPYCGTTSTSINVQGTVAGYFTDSKVVPHSFIRNRQGDFYVFDAPGAGLGPYLYEGTYAASINDRGVVAGQFEDAHLRFHGFIRYPNGTFATVDAPGAGGKANQGTFVTAVSDYGETAGGLVDANNVVHAIVRSAEGKITQFDPPGAVFSQVVGLNARGTTTGIYYDAGSTLHGFVRRPDGTIVTVDAPGAVTGGGAGTEPSGIDYEGVISGYYIDASDGSPHGFLRYPNATQVTFIVPGSLVTFVAAINDFGTIIGGYFDAPAGSGPRGFERSLSGKFTSIDAPGAGGLVYQGTVPVAINDAGVIAGWWRDPKYLAHGFVRNP